MILAQYGYTSLINSNSRKKETVPGDRPHSSRLASAVNEDKVKQVNVVIKAVRRMTIAELYESLQVSHGSACSLVQYLG